MAGYQILFTKKGNIVYLYSYFMLTQWLTFGQK